MSTRTVDKVWKASKNSVAGLMLTPSMVVAAASENNFVAITDVGTVISGPVSFATTSENIRHAGMFTLVNDLARMIPSTIVTPIPQQVPSPPIAFIAHLALVMPTVLAMVPV